VVVPTHNRPQRFLKTIEGLQRQNLDTSQYEIIGVDDGTTAAALPPSIPGIDARLIRFDSVRERAFKRNHGAEVARGRVVVFCDDDLDLEPDFLSLHLRAQREFPGAMVFGRVLLPREALKDPGVAFRQRLELAGMPGRGVVENSPSFGTAANMSIARDVFLDLGGYHDRMVGIEDQDLSMRHTARGGALVYLPEALAIHDDEWLDFQSFCRRQEWGAMRSVAFARAYPELESSQQRESIQGSLRLSDGPLRLAKKMVFRLLGLPPLTAVAHACLRGGVALRVPARVLDRGYRTVLGVHLVRGYLRGVRET